MTERERQKDRDRARTQKDKGEKVNERDPRKFRKLYSARENFQNIYIKETDDINKRKKGQIRIRVVLRESDLIKFFSVIIFGSTRIRNPG